MNCIITGASKGIGLALAYKFAEHGFDLGLCARGIVELEALRNRLHQINPSLKIWIKSVDVSNKEEVEKFASELDKEFAQIDVLINNAGVFLPGEISNEAEGTLEKMIETNLYSAYHLTRAILPSMFSSEKPHIFNMCSIASKIAYPNGGSYSISKFALLGFSKVLREELKEKGIKVTAILPGATWSDSWAGVDLPEDRLMQAHDIANAVFGAYQLSKSAVVEEIVLRPQLGDL